MDRIFHFQQINNKTDKLLKHITKEGKGRMRNLLALIFLFLILSIFTTLTLSSAATFQGLGNLPGGGSESYAWAISADGTVVVGESESATSNETEAFRWTQSTGMVGLGYMSGDAESAAFAISADGSILAGKSQDASWYSEAIRWTASGGFQGLGFLPGTNDGEAKAISADGSVVVGGCEQSNLYIFRWTSSTGMVLIGSGWPYWVSSDGNVIVGVQSNLAFRWTQTTGFIGLGALLGHNVSKAKAISGNGLVIVGSSGTLQSGQAFRWTEAGGMQGLGNLPGGNYYSEANAVSADGSVIVGTSTSGLGREAFIWDSVNGMRNLKDALISDYGINLTGWVLNNATGISNDGKIIIGNGINPVGNVEAWIANLKSIVPAATFQTLGDPKASSGGISGDGSVVVGDLQYGSEGVFKWTETSGIVGLGIPSGYDRAEAYNASYGGSVIVGTSWVDIPFHAEAFRWTQSGGFQNLGVLSAQRNWSFAWDVSGDGAVVVGDSGDEAFIWTPSDGMVGLGFLPGYTSSGAAGVSEDGSVVAGSCWNDTTGRAFRWTASDGLVDLGAFPGYTNCGAMDISADGSTIIGSCDSGDGTIVQAFRWTQASGMVGLGIPAGSQWSQGNAVSGDGSVIIGVDEDQQIAIIWDAANGIRHLKDALINEYGLNLTGWTLGEGNGISRDGKVMTGWGINPSGEYEDWVVNLRDKSVQSDFDHDLDVDGLDLASYINNSEGISLHDFANSFGKLY